ncbi:MAG: hypothetical protein MAG431_00492 [Chloroflexi bacterium]|nr:hypothetical protein [Chloroflexota bacterium]
MDANEIFEFLRSLYLFNSLNDHKLMQVAESFESKSYAHEEILFEEGKKGDYFFIVVSGTIILEREAGYIGSVGKKEYLGEGALLHDRPRSATAKSEQRSMVLRIDKASFTKLVDSHPQVKSLLQLLSRSYEIARRKNFPWLGKDEVIRLIVQKHPTVLLGRLILPAIIALGTIMLSIAFNDNGQANFILFSISLFFLIPWVLWIWVDWGNDYYIVTDKRIAWLEKVVWFYDQRREAPLQTILSVNSSTNQIQRLLGYANVIVRTYTGQITMRNAAHPKELEGIIQDYWHLSEERSEEEETAKLTQAIRSRLGFEDKESEESADGGEGEEEAKETIPTTVLPPMLGNLLKTRFEHKGVITYRKHLYVLLKQIWLHVLILGFLSLALLLSVLNVVTVVSPKIFLLTIGIYFLVSAPFWGYRLFDWANDRFQLTEREIVDLDRKPFGKEDRRSAPLENILSLDYSRENIIQRLLNFGTVAINVGDAQFDFEMVVNPSMVQQEVFEHYYAAVRRKEDAEAQRRREDMVESLAIYHEEHEQYKRSKDRRHDPGSPSVRILWQEDLSKWIALLPEGSVLTLFESAKAEARNAEIRVILTINQQQQSLGRLEYYFPDAPLRTILLEKYNTRFIIGRVEDSIDGNLVSISMQPEEGFDPSEKAIKTSVIKDRVFIIVIPWEEYKLWKSVAWIGIKTVEASISSRGPDASDGYAWESRFYLPVDLDFSA